MHLNKIRFYFNKFSILTECRRIFGQDPNQIFGIRLKTNIRGKTSCRVFYYKRKPFFFYVSPIEKQICKLIIVSKLFNFYLKIKLNFYYLPFIGGLAIPAWAIVVLIAVANLLLGAVLYFVLRKFVLSGSVSNANSYTPAMIEDH